MPARYGLDVPRAPTRPFSPRFLLTKQGRRDLSPAHLERVMDAFCQEFPAAWLQASGFQFTFRVALKQVGLMPHLPRTREASMPVSLSSGCGVPWPEDFSQPDCVASLTGMTPPHQQFITLRWRNLQMSRLLTLPCERLRRMPRGWWPQRGSPG